MRSSSRIYTCELYNYDDKVKRLYEIAFEILPLNQGKSFTPLKNLNETPKGVPSRTSMATLPINELKKAYIVDACPILNLHRCKPDECPIRVHTINGKKITNGYAVAVKVKYEYMGTVLFSILLNRVHYVSGLGNVEYWFPLCERPAVLVDGSIRIHTTDIKDMEIVFLVPTDSLPFMDATGTFAYQYTMVSKMNMLTPKGHVFPKLNTPVTLYQTGDKFRMMQDNTTMVKYKIEGVTIFREMPVFEMQ